MASEKMRWAKKKKKQAYEKKRKSVTGHPGGPLQGMVVNRKEGERTKKKKMRSK